VDFSAVAAGTRDRLRIDVGTGVPIDYGACGDAGRAADDWECDMDLTGGLSLFLGNAYTLIAIISELISIFLGIGTYFVETIEPFLTALQGTGA